MSISPGSVKLLNLNYNYSQVLNNHSMVEMQLEAGVSNVYEADKYYWADKAVEGWQAVKKLKRLYAILLDGYVDLADKNILLSAMDLNDLYNLISKAISGIGDSLNIDILGVQSTVIEAVKSSATDVGIDIFNVAFTVESLLKTAMQNQEANLNTELQLARQAITDDVEAVGTHVVNTLDAGILQIQEEIKTVTAAVEEGIASTAKNTLEALKDTAEDIARKIFEYFRDFVWHRT